MPNTVTPSTEEINQILDKMYVWGRKSDWRGHNKHDGLNSPILRWTMGWHRWMRLVAIQGVMRFPINLRPLFGTPKTYNPKGLALFATASLDRYQYSGEQHHLDEAVGFLDLLRTLVKPTPAGGAGWGYPYPWEDAGFFSPAFTPNAVVTSFVCEAFLYAHRVTGERAFLQPVKNALPFFLSDLKQLKNEPDELCLSYQPVTMTVRVMDVSILVGAVIAQYAAVCSDQELSKTAWRLVNYVVNRQTQDGAWFYTDPPEDSHVKIDNYHTGFILDALHRAQVVYNEKRWAKAYDKGLAFYAKHLFSADGAPRWRSDREYPHDIHGAAQGILTFSRHMDQYSGLVERIAQWAVTTMYHQEGRFYYQESPWIKRRFTLLRWCNGWMSTALARLVLTKHQGLHS
ncbi:MAG: hypothetical protein HQL54_03790 [Magnetococcales bacterium]|nr:hypothetical protein [Magnetococcales bacterium]